MDNFDQLFTRSKHTYIYIYSLFYHNLLLAIDHQLAVSLLTVSIRSQFFSTIHNPIVVSFTKKSGNNVSKAKFPAIKSRQTIRVAGEYWLPLQRLVDLRRRGRDILDEIGAYQTEGSNWNIAGSRDPGPCLVLGFVGNGALGHRNRNPRLRIIPYTLLPLAPSLRHHSIPPTSNNPPFSSSSSLRRLPPFPTPPSASILYRRQEPIYLQRSPSFTLSLSLSVSFSSRLGNEVQIRYSQQWCTDG